MTNQEKRQLIAVELEGWRWVEYRRAIPNYSRHLLGPDSNADLCIEADMSAPIDPLNAGPDYCRAERGLGEESLPCQCDSFYDEDEEEQRDSNA